MLEEALPLKLERLLSSSQLVPPSIFILGSQINISSIIKDFDFDCNFLVAETSCVQGFWPKLLFHNLLLELDSDLQDVKCDSFSEFVSHLKRMLEPSDRVVFFLKKAEFLRDADVNLLPGFLRLHEITGRDICTILVSSISWSKFQLPTGLPEPLILRISTPDRAQLSHHISSTLQREHPELDSSLHNSYAEIVTSVFHLASRCPSELLRVARTNFPKFREPLDSGSITPDNVPLLYRHIEPYLKKSLTTLNLHEVTSTQWETVQRKAAADSALNSTSILRPVTGSAARINVELPFYSKFLLIAAYLASYNPAKTDKRFFMKHHGKQRKTKASIKAKERCCAQLTGPKQFTLDRMMAIFYAIVEERVAPTANILTQITSLVTLQFLTQIGTNDNLDAPAYKCAVGLEFIKGIARTVNFDVLRYLYEYA